MKGVEPLIAAIFIILISIAGAVIVLQSTQPSVDRLKEISLFEESKNILTQIDNAVRTVSEEGQGSTRILQLSVSGGDYIIDAEKDAVVFSMDSRSQIVGIGISKSEGSINMLGEPDKVLLNISYSSINVTGGGNFGKGYHSLTIRNNGYDPASGKQIVSISAEVVITPITTFTVQYNQTQTLVLKGINTTSPNNLNDFGSNYYIITEGLESGGQFNYFQANTKNITGFNTTSADYTNSLDGANYNVTSTVGQAGGIATNRYNQTQTTNITGNASTINQATIDNYLNVNGDSQTWDVTETQKGTQPGPIAVTFYNFTDYTNNKARKASPAGSNRWLAGTEATTTEYTNMQTDNGVFAVSCADASNDEPFWRFNFTINEAESSIQWVNVTFNGRENASESGTCYVYNFTSSAWVSMGTIPTTDSTRSVNYTSNSNYLIDNVNKQLVIVCEGANFDGTSTTCTDAVLADYVLVKVGYILPVPIYDVSVEHNSTVSYSGTLNSINVSINFTSTLNDVYNMEIYDFVNSQWDASPCQSQSVIANNYYARWCNVTANPTNYNSSTGIVRVRLNSSTDTDQGTLKEDYVQYHIDYTSIPAYANISAEHNSSSISENPSLITKINVTTMLKTNISSGIPFNFYIYNFSSGTWELCSQASINNITYSKMECVRVINPSHYVSNSRIRVRLNSSGGTTTHQMMEDYLVYQVTIPTEYRMEVEHNVTGVSFSGNLNNISVLLNFSTTSTDTSTFNFMIYNFNSVSWENCGSFIVSDNNWHNEWCNETTSPEDYLVGGIIRFRLNETLHQNQAEIREDYNQYYVTFTQ